MQAIRFDDDGSPGLVSGQLPQVHGDDVIVHVDFAAINPTDTYHRRRVDPSTPDPARRPGVEVSGTVQEVREGSRWRVGDRVFGLVDSGGLATDVVVSGDLLVARPDSLSEEEAAAVPEAFITAHDAIRQGMLTSGETLLINGATGGVGMAAIQIALRKGARVLATTRSREGTAAIRELGAVAIEGGTATDKTYDDSVDVVIELVGARNARDSLRAIAPGGRLVYVAAQGDEEISFSLRDFKTKRATMIGTTLRRRGRARKVQAVEAFSDEVVPLLASREVTPRISRIFPASEAEAAFDFMTTPGKLGKVLLAFE